jgi:hypothetical protein
MYKAKLFIGIGLACAMMGTGACSRPRATHASVDDLMEDRVMRDGILMKCNRDPGIRDSDIDCLNARVAIERIAAEKESADAAQREAQFERRREQLRLIQDEQRQAEEAAKKVDPYSLPVVPDPAAAAAADSTTAAPPQALVTPAPTDGAIAANH